MGRARYTIRAEDSNHAWRWLMHKMNDPTWLGEAHSFNAYEQLQQLPTQDAAALNQWCEQHLHHRQWQKLKNAIRAARRRNTSPMKTVNLTPAAWARLSQRAAREGCTLSEIIERYI